MIPRSRSDPKASVADRWQVGRAGRWSAWITAVLVAVIATRVWAIGPLIWSAPALWWVALAILVLAIRAGRVPLLAGAWWLVGLASLGWSLTPGTTLVALLWTVLNLAVWAVGSPAALGVAVSWVLLQGVFSTVSLQMVGVSQYFSGSVNYLTGAVALVVLPWMLVTAVRAERWLVRSSAAVLAGFAAYAALSSGARAVYLPLLMMLPLVCGRLATRRVSALRTIGVALALGAMVLIGNVAVPGHPITSALGLKAKATAAVLAAPEGTTGTVSTTAPRGDENGVASRLKMWDQTVRIGLSHPFGTGFGSFRDTIVAFQRFPSVNFSSAHNVFLEVFATQGWLGTVLFLWLMGWSLLRGWRDPQRWPIALGAAGMWLSMAFDITWSVPVIPLLGFWALSESYGPDRVRPVGRGRRLQLGVGITLPVLAIVLALWWYLPCGSAQCVMTRHLGDRSEATQLVLTSSEPDRSGLLARLSALYPKSVWVRYLGREAAATPGQRLEVDRALVREFPLASPVIYLELARLELERGDKAAARDALERGLAVFPPDLSPAGVPLVSRSREYDTWVRESKALLASLPR